MTVGRVELSVAVLWRSFLSGFPLKLLGWCDYCITGDLVAVGFLRVNSLTDCTGILRLMRSSVCSEAASWRLIWTLGGFPVHVWPSFYCWEARTLNQLLSCRVFSNRTATGRQINFSFRSCHFFLQTGQLETFGLEVQGLSARRVRVESGSRPRGWRFDDDCGPSWSSFPKLTEVTFHFGVG